MLGSGYGTCSWIDIYLRCFVLCEVVDGQRSLEGWTMCKSCQYIIITRQLVLDRNYVLMWDQCMCEVHGIWVQARIHVG